MWRKQAAAPPTTTTQPKPKPAPQPKHPQRQPIGKPTKLVVTILDGDQRVRVRGARVSIGDKTGRTNRHGVTTIMVPRGRIAVSVSARGYTYTRARVDFRYSRWQTLDVYRPELQWPLYGATEGRTRHRPRSSCARRSGSSGAAASVA